MPPILLEVVDYYCVVQYDYVLYFTHTQYDGFLQRPVKWRRTATEKEGCPDPFERFSC
jgi:hypothetical protein